MLTEGLKFYTPRCSVNPVSMATLLIITTLLFDMFPLVGCVFPFECPMAIRNGIRDYHNGIPHKNGIIPNSSREVIVRI